MKNNAARARWASVAKKATLATASAALAVSMLPAAAFAAVDADGNVSYTLPTTVLDIQHNLKDSKGNSYTQEYLSVDRCFPPYTVSTYRLLGINDISLQSLPNAKSAASSAAYGLFGTAVNQNPDEYLWNLLASLNGATVPTTMRANRSATQTVQIGGTEYANMPYAIYMEANLINVTSDTISGDYTYSEWVDLENKRADRPKTTKYDPTFVEWVTDNGGNHKLLNSLYNLAQICDDAIESSKDANGNYAYATRYAEGANTVSVVDDIQDFWNATEYYILSQVDKGALKKRRVAVLCGYDTSTNNYACRILQTATEGSVTSDLTVSDGDPNGNAYSGRLSNCVNQICDDICTLGLTEAQAPASSGSSGWAGNTDESQFVKWYTADQILSNTDAILINGTTGGAHDSAGNSNSLSAANLKVLTDAQASAKAAGKTVPDICQNWPSCLFGLSAQGCENPMMGPLAACFVYPEAFNLTDTMAWYAKHIWHINDASLQDIVDTTCYSVSIASNEKQLGTISATFDSDMNAKMNEGNVYYINNTEKVDALNFGNIKTYDLDALKARTTGWADISKATIKVEGGNFVYTGSAITPAITVTVGGDVLTADKDYTLSFKNNTNAGTATVTVTGKGAYTGTATSSFTISKAAYDMSGVKFDSVTATYDGEKHGCTVSGTLPSGVSVTYLCTGTGAGTYIGNSATDAGSYAITATFSGDSNHDKAQSMVATLTINKAAGALTAKAAKSTFKVNASKAQTTSIKLTGTNGTVTFKSNKSGVTVNKSGKVTVKKGFKGTATITVKDSGNGNYKAASAKVTIKVK